METSRLKACLLGGLIAAAAALPQAAQATSSIGNRDKYCPVGYGCIYGLDSRGWFTQGLDIAAGNPNFVALPYVFSGNARQVRNRNATTRRSVVLLDINTHCVALRYDSRTWVNVPSRAGGSGFTAQSMGLTTLSRAPGSTTNVAGCRTTRWI